MKTMTRQQQAHKRTLQVAMVLALSAASAGTASATCYMVYSNQQQVIYRSQTPPVDMSQPLHQTLGRVAPGSSMVFALDTVGCELEVNHLPDPASLRAPSTSGASTKQPALRKQRRTRL